ncbi:MAG: hypothetical protein ACJAWX_002433, partial [Algoriphagus sp.]
CFCLFEEYSLPFLAIFFYNLLNNSSMKKLGYEF